MKFCVLVVGDKPDAQMAPFEEFWFSAGTLSGEEYQWDSATLCWLGAAGDEIPERPCDWDQRVGVAAVVKGVKWVDFADIDIEDFGERWLTWCRQYKEIVASVPNGTPLTIYYCHV